MKPTIEDAQAKIDQVERLYSDFMTELGERRTMADLEFSVPSVPKEVTLHKTVTPRTKIDRMADQLVTDIPTFEIEMPHEPTKKAEGQKDKQLKAAKFFFRQAELQNDMPPAREGAIFLCTYGCTARKTIYIPAWHKAGKHPILTRAINPECVYPPLPDGTIVECYDKSVATFTEEIKLMEARGRRISWDKGNLALDSSIKWYEVWFSEDESGTYWRAILIGEGDSPGKDAKPLFDQGIMRNIFDCIPIDYVVSAWGTTPKDGDMKRKARGLNDYLLDTYRADSHMLSLEIASATLDALGEKAVQREKWEKQLIKAPEHIGQPWQYDQDPEEIHNLQHSSLNRDVYTTHDIIRWQIDEQTFHAGVGGERQAGSGYQEALLMSQDLKKARPARKQLELLEIKATQKYFLYATLFGPFDIGPRDKITKSDIVLPIDLKINLEPIDPEKQQAEMLATAKLVIDGLWSWEEWASNSGIIEDLNASRKLIWIDRIMKSPTVQKAMDQKVLEEWGMAEIAAIIAEEREAQQRQSQELTSRQAAHQADIANYINSLGQGAVLEGNVGPGMQTQAMPTQATEPY